MKICKQKICFPKFVSQKWRIFIFIFVFETLLYMKFKNLWTKNMAISTLFFLPQNMANLVHLKKKKKNSV